MRSKFAMEVYNPCGTVQVTNLHAPRLDTLGGKTIGELSNGDWEYARTFALIRELLQKRFPDAKIVPFTEFPMGTLEIDVENIGEVVKEKGCDCVILGNAA